MHKRCLKLWFVFIMLFLVHIKAEALTVNSSLVKAPVKSGVEYWYTIANSKYLFTYGANGVDVLDISADPSHPTLLTQPDAFKASSLIYVGSQPKPLAVTEQYLYVATKTTPIQVVKFDISNIANPVKVASADLASFPQSMAIQGNYLYVSQEGNGTYIYNISGNQISYLSKINSATSGGVTPGSIIVEGNYMYTSQNNSSTLNIVKLSNSDPTVMETKYTWTAPANTTIAYLSKSGNYVYLSSANNTSPKVYVLDVSNPSQIASATARELVGVSAKDGTVPKTYRTIVDGRLLYVAYSTVGQIDVYDLADPLNIAKVKTVYPTTGSIFDMCKVGNTIYTAERASGVDAITFSIYDVKITSPSTANPLPVNTLSISGTSIGASQIAIKVDGQSVGTVSPQGDGSWNYSLSTDVEDGPVTITAEAKDAGGNVLDSIVKTYTIHIPTTLVNGLGFSAAHVQTGEIRTSATITNEVGNPEGSQKVMLITALYYDGELIAAGTDEKTLNPGDVNIPFSSAITIPVPDAEKDIRKYSVVAYVWQDIHSIKPLWDYLSLATAP